MTGRPERQGHKACEMSVRVTCPHCGEAFGLERVLSGQIEKRFAYALGRFGQARLPLMTGFLNCFKSPGGRLSVNRRVSILEEVWGIIEAGKLRYDRRIWRVDFNQVLAAMDETRRAKELKGLSNLNYFKRILATKANESEAQAEAAQEERRRQGRRDDQTGPVARGGEPEHIGAVLTQFTGGGRGR